MVPTLVGVLLCCTHDFCVSNISTFDHLRGLGWLKTPSLVMKVFVGTSTTIMPSHHALHSVDTVQRWMAPTCHSKMQHCDRCYMNGVCSVRRTSELSPLPDDLAPHLPMGGTCCSNSVCLCQFMPAPKAAVAYGMTHPLSQYQAACLHHSSIFRVETSSSALYTAICRRRHAN